MTGVRYISGALRVLGMVCLGMATLVCSRSVSGSVPVAVPLAAMSAAEQRARPLSISLDLPLSASLDLPLQAFVYAWHNFRPVAGTPTNARGLTVSVRVRGGIVPPREHACADVQHTLIRRETTIDATS